MTSTIDTLKEVFELGSFHNDDLRSALIQRISDLINNDQHRLIALLYRLDINEGSLQEKLADHSNAAERITDMIIARQLEKQKTRQQFRQDPTDIPDEERW